MSLEVAGSTSLPADVERGRSVRRAAMLTSGVGLAHAVLFLLAFWLLSNSPGPSDSNAEIADFYADGGNRRLILLGLYVMPFAGISFIWFIVALRMWISGSQQRENALLSNIQLVSGIIYVALFFIAGAASGVTSATIQFSDAQIDPVVARQFPHYGTTILLVFAMRMAAMFVFTTTGIARSVGLLPRWFIWLGYGVGLFLLLSVSLSGALVLVFPVWLLILCCLLFLRARTIPRDLVRQPSASPAPERMPRASPGAESEAQS